MKIWKIGFPRKMKDSVLDFFPRGFLIVLAVTTTFGTAGTSVGDTGFKVAVRTPMHKVLLTQKGYIQFLRWELPVPNFKEFTFCLWMRSNNLTHAHSIFSYSKHERDRLVRSWISGGGHELLLEIDGKEVFRREVNVKENRWYHVCVSWENQRGHYAFWMNGRIQLEGESWQNKGHVIPSGGDIVLGQEYTDFDKGLEEGIEGAVLGFNLLLASAFGRTSGEKILFEPEIPKGALARNQQKAPFESTPQASISIFSKIPYILEPIRKTFQDAFYQHSRPAPFTDKLEASKYREVDNARVLVNVDWTGKRVSAVGNRDLSRNLRARRRRRSRGGGRSVPVRNCTGLDSFEDRRIRRGIRLLDVTNDRHLVPAWQKDPLGLQLVKISYFNCVEGRGSPRIGGKLMLISWSRTPVKVFGGATLKNAKDTCGNF